MATTRAGWRRRSAWARRAADALLVVDDYHHASGSEEAEAFFEELVALTEFRLLITSRERPSWFSARRVVYGEATVVEMDALAFTDEEARTVLGDDSAERLLTEARGWPAVIGLAAMRGVGRRRGGHEAGRPLPLLRRGSVSERVAGVA